MTRVIVLGDVLLDVDVDTRSERVAPDSGAPVLDVVHRVQRAGGAALAATLAARDGVDVTLVAAIPPDAAGQALRASLGAGVRLLEVPCTGRTAVKTRVRRGGHTVVRLDEGGRHTPVTGAPDGLADLLAGADAVLVSDYGRGLTGTPCVRDALAGARDVVWDPHPRGAAPIGGAALVTPNAAEAAAALGLAADASLAGACDHARRLVERWRARGVAVTRGSAGAVLALGANTASAFPSERAVSGDTCGAGDRFAAAAATAVARGALPSEAVGAAVAAAGRFVAAGGVAALESNRLSPSDETPERPPVLVATGGCFDLLHPGHVATLEAARSLGDRLVVCVNSDESVHRLKGDGRPVQPVADRVRVLRGLRAVDDVVVFDEDTPEQVLRRLRPDVWVKGGDYAGTEMAESGLVRSWGGEVVTVPYVEGRSTTSLIGRTPG